MESLSSLREARSGSSTPLRHTGASTLSRGLSLSKAASQAASEDMRKNIEVLYLLQRGRELNRWLTLAKIGRRGSKSFKN